MPLRYEEYNLSAGTQYARHDIDLRFKTSPGQGIFIRRPLILLFSTMTGKNEFGYEDRREGDIYLYYAKGVGNADIRREPNLSVFNSRQSGDDLLVFSETIADSGYIKFLGKFTCMRCRLQVPTFFGTAAVFELKPQDPHEFGRLDVSEACSDIAKYRNYQTIDAP